MKSNVNVEYEGRRKAEERQKEAEERQKKGRI